MAVRTRSIPPVVALLLTLLLGPRSAFACGPFFPVTVFTYSERPDFPLERFARGTLGVLQPAYAQSYLYVAYRHLTGIGFDAEEAKAIETLWNERLKRGQDPDWKSRDEAIREWRDTRATVPGAGPALETGSYRTMPKAYFYYLNCPADAYRTAASTLKKRIGQFGAASPEVREWLEAQDQVFLNCSKGHVIPAADTTSPQPLIRADRAYQIAAARFYAGDFDVAEELFKAIAQDRSSPWAKISSYLVARTLVRKATLLGPQGQTDPAPLGQAEARLTSILGDPRLRETHLAARSLLNLVRARLHPAERLQELGEALLKKSAGATMKQDLDDYTTLLDRGSGEARDDLTDWIRTFQGHSKGGFDRALRKWEETSSLPWLVASLAWIAPSHPQVPRLLDAARNIKPDSPAYPSVMYHSLRLLMEAGRTEEARQWLDALLSGRAGTLPPSSRNLFLALRMKLSRDLGEFLRFAPRVPVGIGYDVDSSEALADPSRNRGEVRAFADGRALLDTDGARILNERMPLSLLRDAVKSGMLPTHLRRELALATWVRAVLLDDQSTGLELAPVVVTLAPELSGLLRAYRSAPNREARRFAGTFAIMNVPGMRPYVGMGVSRLAPLGEIDDLRDNWWCAFSLDAELESSNYLKMAVYESRTRDGKPFRRTDHGVQRDFPSFLSEAQKAAARKEWNALLAIPTAPNYFGRQVIQWARKNPRDSRVPEALHLTVASTRYGCTEADTSELSKAAFRLLHDRYPQSPWARQTPYWY